MNFSLPLTLMDITKFSRLVNDPSKTVEEVETMMRNAIRKNEPEFARVAKEALDIRFPGWDSIRHRDSRATPTLVRFNSSEQEFSTAKEAYCWLIERFVETYPGPFNEINWETYFFGAGRTRMYFARDLKRMFRETTHLASDRNNFRRLSNGWYANLNLNNEQKWRILCKFAAVAKFSWEREWYWKVLD